MTEVSSILFDYKKIQIIKYPRKEGDYISEILLFLGQTKKSDIIKMFSHIVYCPLNYSLGYLFILKINVEVPELEKTRESKR